MMNMLIHCLGIMNLSDALIGFGSPEMVCFSRHTATLDSQTVEIGELEEYSIQSWESVLHNLVGTISGKRHGAVLGILERAGLMVREE